MANVFDGGCHCGAVCVRFTTDRAPEDLDLRACGCSFCRKHGARTVTDPAGQLELTRDQGSSSSSYTFASGTAEFVVCTTCGVYVAAVLRAGDADFATLNVNCLDEAYRFTSTPWPVTYDEESPETRIARRMTRWTPARLR